MRGGRMRPISSSMLDDRSSATTMSSPREVMTVCEYGSAGSISAQPSSRTAIVSTASGSRRSHDARYSDDPSQPIVVDATKRRFTRQRSTPSAASAPSIHQPSSG